MKLKDKVDGHRVHQDLWCILSQIEQEHQAWTGQELVLTSMRRKQRAKHSKHSPGPCMPAKAADIRRGDLDAIGRAEEFCKTLQKKFGRYIGVVLEPDWLTPKEIRQRGGLAKIGPHIHIQLKSKPWPRVR